MVWLAVDDDREDAMAEAQRLEAADFFIHIFALRRIGRADDDQKLRGFERRQRLLAKRLSGGKIFPVAENWTQGLWNRPNRRLPSNKVLVDSVAFERSVKPLTPRRVARWL
jgi:hypothetical protein